MIDAFATYLNASGILPAGSKAVVACSGGPDATKLFQEDEEAQKRQ